LDNKKEIEQRANWFLTLCKILQRRNAGLMQLKASQLQKKKNLKLSELHGLLIMPSVKKENGNERLLKGSYHVKLDFMCRQASNIV